MRKVLSVLCVVASVILGIYLDYIAYRITVYTIDSKLAMLIFIPVFIVIYWLGHFYDGLSSAFTKKVRRILRMIYTASLFSVCAVWLWIIYKYTYFFGELLGSIKQWLSS